MAHCFYDNAHLESHLVKSYLRSNFLSCHFLEIKFGSTEKVSSLGSRFVCGEEVELGTGKGLGKCEWGGGGESGVREVVEDVGVGLVDCGGVDWGGLHK